jgi:hypothetical protein
MLKNISVTSINAGFEYLVIYLNYPRNEFVQRKIIKRVDIFNF